MNQAAQRGALDRAGFQHGNGAANLHQFLAIPEQVQDGGTVGGRPGRAWRHQCPSLDGVYSYRTSHSRLVPFFLRDLYNFPYPVSREKSFRRGTGPNRITLNKIK